MKKMHKIFKLSSDERAAFCEKVIKGSAKNGCWVWSASKNNQGYGQVTIRQRHFLAHRVSWSVHRGAIPRGRCVLHVCDNPACVNPSHLFIGSMKDNTRDMVAKGRAYTGDHRGEKNSQSKITVSMVKEIRRSKNTYKDLAKIYGVTFGMIGHIKTRRTWRHI